MIRCSFLICYVLVSANSVADQGTVEESEIVDMNSAILRETFAEPLNAELLNRGFTPLRAASASKRLLDGLTECWKSDLNETNEEEPVITSVHMGGNTIMAYKTPCLEYFLVAVGAAKP